MCVAGKIAYHLYTFDTSKSDGIVKLIRKSRWHSQQETNNKRKYKFISHCELILIYWYQDNFIAGFDFNPNGEIAVTIDCYGVCLISDVNTDDYRFHLDMEMTTRFGKQQFEYLKYSKSFFPLVVPLFL